jgi:cytochrome c biogenesis factor
MIWVWIGCLLMSVGGFVAIFSRKQSLKWPLTTTATSKNKKPINEKGQESARPI